MVVVILVYRMDPSSSTVFQGDNRIGFTAPPRLPHRRFDNTSIHMTKALASLGPNVLTVYSRCRMARWVYPFCPHSNLKYNHWKYNDCNAFNNPNKVLRNISQLSENDTIRPAYSIESLCKAAEGERTLGGYCGCIRWMVISQTVKPNVQEDIDYVIAHPHVIRWFIQNLDLYGGNNYTQPTKVDPFPYRIQERPYGDKNRNNYS